MIKIIYDGDCPLCSATAVAIKLKQSVGKFELIDARVDHELATQLSNEGYDLNAGFVVIYQGSIYHGTDAAHMIAMLSTTDSWWRKLAVSFFREPGLVKVCYPLLKSGRQLLLWLRRKQPFAIPLPPIFRAVYGAKWQELNPLFKRKYSVRPYSNDSIKAQGFLDIYYPQWLRSLSYLAAKLNLFFPYSSKPQTTIVEFNAEPNSNAYVFKRQILNATGRKLYLNSKLYHLDSNKVIDVMPGGIGWIVEYSYINPDEIHFLHRGWGFRLLGLTIPLPISWLIGKGSGFEKIQDSTKVALRLQVEHRLWGKLLQYSGEFTLAP